MKSDTSGPSRNRRHKSDQTTVGVNQSFYFLDFGGIFTLPLWDSEAEDSRCQFDEESGQQTMTS